MSTDGRRMLELWTNLIRTVAGHYQFPIPFCKDLPKFPDNRMMPEHRLVELRRRLLRNPHLLQRYETEMQKLLSKEYRLNQFRQQSPAANQTAPRYLPHHPVFQQNKLEKVLIIFACAAVSIDVWITAHCKGPT